MSGRSWDELDKETSFTEEIEGFAFVLREPSVTKLTALGILPPSIMLGNPGRAHPGKAPEPSPVERVLLGEAQQTALLLASVIEPKLSTDGAEGTVSVDSLGRFRDALVIAILNRLGGRAEVVEAARFPDEAPAGAADRPDGADARVPSEPRP